MCTSYALKAGAPFFTVVHTILREASFSYREKNDHIRDSGGGRVKTEHLRIKVAFGGSFESRVHTHCSCCWRPLWKQSTYTL